MQAIGNIKNAQEVIKMKRFLAILTSTIIASSASASSFPHRTAIFSQTTTNPMMEVSSKLYVSFSEKKYTSAEWETQNTSTGTKRTLKLNDGKFIYTVDLDANHCTKTKIDAHSLEVKDPTKLANEMKRQMGLEKDGACQGAGLKGTQYKSSFGKMCFYKDVFLLWQEVMGSRTKITDVKFDVALPKNKTKLPSGINCTEGNRYSNQFDYNQSSSYSSSREKHRHQNPENIEEAMKQAKEAMQQLGNSLEVLNDR